MTELPNQQKMTAPPRATVFAVTSGKGGVGKTSIAVNLACEFSRRGLRTVLLDADLGLANAHILAGMRPTKTLCDYIDGTATLADIAEHGPAHVKFIAGGSGVQAMADIDAEKRQRLVGAVEDLRPFCDVVIVDTGAGVSSNVIDFLGAADHVILVTTSNFAAIADAYGIVKVSVQNGHKQPIHCVINRVRTPEEGEQVFAKLLACTKQLLGFDLNWLGVVPEDGCVEGAILKRAPFTEAYPGSVAARYLTKLVTALISKVQKTTQTARAAH